MAASVNEPQPTLNQDTPAAVKAPDEDDELEDGELDTDDDDDVPPIAPASETGQTTTSTSIKSSATNAKTQSSPSHHKTSSLHESNEPRSSSKRRRTSSFNSKNDKGKRHNRGSALISDSDDSESDQDSKIDSKSMMIMFKKMQEMLKSASDHKLSHRKRSEMNKMFEKMKKCNSKEIARMFRKNPKMMKFDADDSIGFGNSIGTGSSGDNFGRGSPDHSGHGSNGASFVSSWTDDVKGYSKRSKNKHDERSKSDDLCTKDGIPRQQQLCKFYLEGHCNRGNDCAFIHQLPNHVALKREVCKFYLQDSCGKGDNCTFLHKEFPCKFFHTGVECIAGENCRFSHEPIDEEMREIFNNYIGNHDLNEELNQGYSFFGAGSSVSRPAILGDPIEEIKHSYRTWMWQQEMKKLEEAYQGTKRNLFCVPEQFVIKEQPEYDSECDEEFFGNSAEFGDEENHVLPEANFYIDTIGANDADSTKPTGIVASSMIVPDDEEELRKLCANDLDLRTMDIKDLANTPFGLDFDDSPDDDSIGKEDATASEDIKSNPALKHWLGEDTDDDDDGDQPLKNALKKLDSITPDSSSSLSQASSSKANIDITKMLDAIRQSTVKSGATPVEPPERHNDFWRSILNGVPLSSGSSNMASTPIANTTNNATSALSTGASSLNARDPRLKRQRNPIAQPGVTMTSTSAIEPLSRYPLYSCGRTPPHEQRIISDEQYTLSEGDVSFRLYQVDIDKIDYSKYASQFHTDARMRNDPRLQKFFNQSISGLGEPGSGHSSMLPQFPALTLSNKPKIESIVPPPTPLMSAFELMSSSSSAITTSTSSNSLLNLDLQMGTKDSIIPQGLSGLANLVTEKSKRNAHSPLLDSNSTTTATLTSSILGEPASSASSSLCYKTSDTIGSPESGDPLPLTVTPPNHEHESTTIDDEPDSPPPNRLTIMDDEPSSPRLVIESDV